MKRFAILLLCVACSKAATPQASPSPSPSPTPSARTSTFVSVATAPPPTDLADGTTYAYVKSLDTTHSTVTVDVVQFLTGDAAEKAAHDDGKEAFDYYVRNQNTKLRTLGYAPSVKVVVNTLTAEETGSSTKDTTITLARLQSFLAKGEAQHRLFYVVLKNHVVTTIHEQYLP